MVRMPDRSATGFLAAAFAGGQLPLCRVCDASKFIDLNGNPHPAQGLALSIVRCPRWHSQSVAAGLSTVPEWDRPCNGPGGLSAPVAPRTQKGAAPSLAPPLLISVEDRGFELT